MLDLVLYAAGACALFGIIRMGKRWYARVWFNKILKLKLEGYDDSIIDAIEEGTWHHWKQRNGLLVSSKEDALQLLQTMPMETVYEKRMFGYVLVVTMRPEQGGYVNILELFQERSSGCHVCLEYRWFPPPPDDNKKPHPKQPHPKQPQQMTT